MYPITAFLTIMPLMMVITPTLCIQPVRYIIEFCDLFGGKDFGAIQSSSATSFSSSLLAKGVQFLLLGKKGDLIRSWGP